MKISSASDGVSQKSHITGSSKSSEVKTEYSFNDIVKLDPLELNGKIFTYDKRLTQGDLTKINQYDNQNLMDLFKKLKCMRGLEQQYIPKFKFF